jgi:hypothetical protein
MKTVSPCFAGAILLLLIAGAAFGQESESSRFEIEVDAIGVLQHSPGYTGVGGADFPVSGESPSGESDASDGATEASALFELDLIVRPWESGKARMRVKAGLGGGIDEAVPAFSTFNAAAIGTEPLIEELWYEHAFGEKVRLRGGKMDMTMEFDANAVANDEYDQFLSYGFMNNLAVEFPEETGLGAMLWFSPDTLFDIGVGFADAVGGWDDVFNSLFSIVELGMKSEIAGKEGNYRIYAWHNGGEHESLSGDSKANYGFGLSTDQQVAEGVTLFARYGRQRGIVSPVGQAWSAGLGITGKFFGRDEDTVGLAFGQAVMGKSRKAFDTNFGDEYRMELYYNTKVNNNLNITPDLQWVKNPLGNKANSSAWVFGVRAFLHFSN